MKSKIFLATAVAALLSPSAFASDFSYSYGEITGGELQVDGGKDANLITGTLSVEFGDNFYGVASANRAKFSDGPLDLSVNNAQLGLGYHGSVSKSTDVYAVGSVLSTETKVSFMNFKDSDSETGYSLDLGVRHAIDEYFEIGASVAKTRQYHQYSTTYTLTGIAHVSESLDVVLVAQNLSDANAYSAGLRYNF